jgi:hypothetical protein
MFDSNDLTWRLPTKKIEKAKVCIHSALYHTTVNLREFQRLVGRINNIGQMCPFMKIFKQIINDFLSGIGSNALDDLPILITNEAKDDLWIWAGFLHSSLVWLPIAPAPSEPPRLCTEFVSDAAGLAESADLRTRPGCGNVGFSENGEVIFANQFLWPKDFILHAVDEKGVRYGDKTTTLEMIGLIMPLLLVPHLVANQNVRFMVDCFGAVYGMHTKAAKGDKSASIFIRAAYLITGYLNCNIYVQHLPRISDWGAEVSDRLSRVSSCTTQDRKLLSAFRNRPVPQCLLNWFEKPTVDFNLATSLLSHVKSIYSA